MEPSQHAWAAYGGVKGKITTPRLNKRVSIFSVKEKHNFADADGIERTVTLRRVMRVTEWSTDKKAQMLLEPDIGLEG